MHFYERHRKERRSFRFFFRKLNITHPPANPANPAGLRRNFFFSLSLIQDNEPRVEGMKMRRNSKDKTFHRKRTEFAARKKKKKKLNVEERRGMGKSIRLDTFTNFSFLACKRRKRRKSGWNSFFAVVITL